MQPLPQNADDGRERTPCYFCIEIALEQVDMASHSFIVDGKLNIFWVCGREKVLPKPDLVGDGSIPQGSFAALGSGPDFYQEVCELKDDGVRLPINPNHLFHGGLTLRHTAPSKALFDPEHSAMFYTVAFEAALKLHVDLRRFPFDRLTANIVLNLRSGTYVLLTEAPTWVPVKWNLKSPVKLSFSSRITSEYAARKALPFIYDNSHWKPAVRIMLERRPEHWVVNGMLPTGLITSLSYQCYWVIPADNTTARGTFAITLLLTLIALKFALSSGLPIVPYVTYLDSYLISACVVLVMTARPRR